MVVTLTSPNGNYDSVFLANYVYINLVDAMTRVPGIASVTVFGAGQYATRIWVDPDKLASLNITVPEIVSAINAQNTVNPAGQIGAEPIPRGQPFTNTVRAQGRLITEEDFANVVLRANVNGSFVRVKNVARESWALPISVLICTPVAVFGAFLTLFGRQLENNVYAQIGLAGESDRLTPDHGRYK